MGVRSPLYRYARWLHLQWPAGTVEKLPEVRPDGSTSVPGLYVVGDLTGVPLLKFSSDSGGSGGADHRGRSRVREASAAGGRPRSGHRGSRRLRYGRGPRGPQAGPPLRASRGVRGLLDPRELPKGKADLQVSHRHDTRGGSAVHRALGDQGGAARRAAARRRLTAGIELRRTVRAERVARSGGGLEVSLADGETAARPPGDRGHRPLRQLPQARVSRGRTWTRSPTASTTRRTTASSNVLVVGGGDSALETAIALGACGAHVTLSYRKPELSRPKPENVEKLRTP